MSVNPGARAWTLYRFFTSGGQLLYVGRTVNLPQRLSGHRATKPWWSDVARIDVEHFANAKALDRAERKAIKQERPHYNIALNTRPSEPLSTGLSWACDGCGRLIADDAGYLTADPRKANRAVSLMGEKEAWSVFHYDCDPLPDAPDYWIPVDRLRTRLAVEGWDDHLASKRWITGTNWEQVVAAAYERLQREAIAA